IAWSENKQCVICHEFCPYSAVRLVSRGRVNVPEVFEDRCVGCGICEHNCPAEPRAIVVYSPGISAGGRERSRKRKQNRGRKKEDIT
ncbi:MAG: 4Fe-4S binding protein, partial [Candidatus Eremiobacteraeota bacterium]|nr:4Fe-4S binding protein [Candidatus Eremiobacteraeota bacterium]